MDEIVFVEGRLKYSTVVLILTKNLKNGLILKISKLLIFSKVLNGGPLVRKMSAFLRGKIFLCFITFILTKVLRKTVTLARKIIKIHLKFEGRVLMKCEKSLTPILN